MVDREFAASIRTEATDDAELRESLKTFGWRKELPAIKDEHGNVIVGNRRLRIAREEGINPVIMFIKFGDDHEATKLAIASNLGSVALAPKDRARIAERLYGENGWTMTRIAAALNVSQATISSDLVNLSALDKLPERAEKRGRPKAPPKPKEAKTTPHTGGPQKWPMKCCRSKPRPGKKNTDSKRLADCPG
jgi:ParB-like chromosome segregation protein Spo0J